MAKSRRIYLAPYTPDRAHRKSTCPPRTASVRWYCELVAFSLPLRVPCILSSWSKTCGIHRVGHVTKRKAKWFSMFEYVHVHQDCWHLKVPVVSHVKKYVPLLHRGMIKTYIDQVLFQRWASPVHFTDFHQFCVHSTGYAPDATK